MQAHSAKRGQWGREFSEDLLMSLRILHSFIYLSVDKLRQKAKVRELGSIFNIP